MYCVHVVVLRAVRHLSFAYSSLYGCQDVVPSVLALYSATGHLPDPQHVVIACRDTTEDDINLLLGRCFHPALWKAGSPPLYMIVNAHLLAIDVQDVLVRTLKSYRKEFPDARCRLAITHKPDPTAAILAALGPAREVAALKPEVQRVSAQPA